MATSRPVRVVAFGGGTGLSRLLMALRKVDRPMQVTAIVAVSDDGGSSGRLRRVLPMPAMGDARACLSALAGNTARAALLEQRLRHGPLAGHAVGNLVLAGLWRKSGSLTEALDRLRERIDARGRVVPCTESNVRLIARRTDGSRVDAQCELSRHRGRIERVWLDPPADTSPEASEVLHELSSGDLIFFAPGSLFSSLIASLLPRGLAEAVAGSPARRVGIANLAPQPGETDGMEIDDEQRAIESHFGVGLIDTLLVDPSRAGDGGRRKGIDRLWAPLRMPGTHRHDPALLAEAISRHLFAASRRSPTVSLRPIPFR